MSQSPSISLVDTIAASVKDDASIATVNDSVRESIGKVICVGRNYAEHARELGNEIPKSPILFMKPASSVVSVHNDIVRPNPALYGDTHYEAELCIQLVGDLSAATIEQAKQAIGGVTLGLDLTL
ncbi:fumarylacetoacetate hydrolase family protein, partial [Psychrobacter sp. 16-Bac2893]